MSIDNIFKLTPEQLDDPEELKELEMMLQGEVYQAIIGYVEGLEHQKVYLGNGHHCSQKLCALVAKRLVERYGHNKF